jgi:hypothetical protein
MCQVTEMMVNTSISATSGLAIAAAMSACDEPTWATQKMTKKMVSGMLATAVSRWCQKCSVPSFAEPRPRTLPRGVLMFICQPLALETA